MGFPLDCQLKLSEWDNSLKHICREGFDWLVEGLVLYWAQCWNVLQIYF